MTQTVSVKDFQEHAPEILARLTGQDDILIEDGGKPIARLAAIAGTPAAAASQDQKAARPLGMFHGKIWMSPDFDAELPENFWSPPNDSASR